MTNKKDLKKLLSEHIVKVTFNKKDGTERVMSCTLHKDYLPAVEQKENKKTKKENDNVLPVWDLDKQAFRSFRIESLKDYKILEPYEL